jgi:hypothetical protein
MNAIYIELSAAVRYWEDAIVNGVEDTDGTLIPHRKGQSWVPVICLADGLVMDWPQGTTADVHYKVCDAGQYWLQDADRKRVAKWEGFYVPNDFLCHGDTGYGDYIIFKVGADGLIEKWRKPAIQMVCPCDEEAQHGWAEMPATQQDSAIRQGGEA